MHCVTASIIAVEVTVAPVTVSTEILLFSTIAAGTCSKAASATPSVSCWSVTSTFVMTPFSNVVLTVRSAFLPATVASYSPVIPVASDAEEAAQGLSLQDFSPSAGCGRLVWE